MKPTERRDYDDTVVVRSHVVEPAAGLEPRYVERREAPAERARPSLADWPLAWSAIWAGGLIALTAAIILGLAASAIGDAAAASHLTEWAAYSRAALIYSIFTALLAFFLGGFFAVKIAGIERFEAALLHGAMTWLIVLPALLLLGAIGAGHFFGNYAMGVIAPPVWINPGVSNSAVDPAAAGVARDVAVSALLTVLMGLVGGVLGGCLAAGEMFERRPDVDRPAQRYRA